ncbi:MAG: hypothetical protein WCL08_04045 [Verrucomicrobiota bacterium]
MFASVLTVAYLKEETLLKISTQLDNMAAALIAIPAILFAVRVSLVTEMAKRIMETTYVNEAKRFNTSPLHSVKELNSGLTIVNTSCLLAIALGMVCRELVFSDATKKIILPLTSEQTFGLRASLAITLISFACIIWVIWKVHINVRQYLEWMEKGK